VARGEALTRGDDPAVTGRLVEAITKANAPRLERLAFLHILGYRRDTAVDTALIGLLADPELRPLAAYLLGRAGFKGYPARARSVRATADALAHHLGDTSKFADPWTGESYQTQDLVLAAFIRVAGPERFRIADPARAGMIGYELARFDAPTRASLLAQARQLDRSTLP